MDQFLQKPFWFFLRIFSISGSLQLSSRVNLRSKSYTLVVFGNSKVTFLGDRNDVALCPSIYCVLVIYGVALSEQYVVRFSCFPYFWRYFIETGNFPVFNFYFSSIKILLSYAILFRVFLRIIYNENFSNILDDPWTSWAPIVTVIHDYIDTSILEEVKKSN